MSLLEPLHDEVTIKCTRGCYAENGTMFTVPIQHQFTLSRCPKCNAGYALYLEADTHKVAVRLTTKSTSVQYYELTETL